MRKIQKLLAVLLAIVMVFSLGSLAFADERAPAYTVTGDYSGKTVIIHTNDIHGAVENYAKIAALEAEFVAAGAEVILIDAGDYIQGTTYVSVSQGATAIDLMNKTGYDIVTLGNHEFDFGYENLKTILAEAEFEVTTNIKYNGSNVYDASITVETAAGPVVEFIGLTTAETATKAHPAKIKGVTFPAGDAVYAETQEIVDASEADVIIAITHLGVDDSSDPNRSTDVYAEVEGLDFIIDGHSHTVMTKGENGEPIQSTGTKAENVGLIVIGEEGIESNELIDLSTYASEDATVKAAAEAIVAEIEEIYGAPFASTEVLLNGERDPGVRTQATNLGDLIADAILWQATKDGGLPVPEENVVAITNGGGIRATIKEGDITMNQINTVLPFGNTVAFVYVTGAELLEALEASTYCTPKSVGAFPQTAGIKYTLDTTKEYDQGELYPDSTYYGPKSINRVTVESINGKAFDEKATYAIVTNDFLAAGGDTYYAFSVAENVIDTGVPMDEAVVAYITEVLDGKVTAAAYGEADDELTIIYEKEEEDPPVEIQVVPSSQALAVDGVKVSAEAYNIDGSNYFKLRDLAALLTGTAAKFDIEIDGDKREIYITTGKAYTPVGGELEIGEDKSSTCVASEWTIYVNDVLVGATAYNIGGNNYFMLRDLGEAMDFCVHYLGYINTILVFTEE